MKASIYYNKLTREYDLLFYEDRLTANGLVTYVVEPIKMILRKHEDGVQITPTFTVPRESAQEFMNSIAESLDEHGIKTDKDAKIEGTLSATRIHLEDLRRIVFKKEYKALEKESNHG